MPYASETYDAEAECLLLKSQLPSQLSSIYQPSATGKSYGLQVVFEEEYQENLSSHAKISDWLCH